MRETETMVILISSQDAHVNNVLGGPSETGQGYPHPFLSPGQDSGVHLHLHPLDSD